NDEATIDFFKCYFNDVVAVEKVFNPYAKFAKDYWQTIYVCKAPKQNFAGLKKIFEKRVFE
ncbi:MAG: hypothetical protein ABI685_13735, partial [Ferruginibacter sp.]